jgi:hypothetical protein
MCVCVGGGAVGTAVVLSLHLLPGECHSTAAVPTATASLLWVDAHPYTCMGGLRSSVSTTGCQDTAARGALRPYGGCCGHCCCV